MTGHPLCLNKLDADVAFTYKLRTAICIFIDHFLSHYVEMTYLYGQ